MTRGQQLKKRVIGKVFPRESLSSAPIAWTSSTVLFLATSCRNSFIRILVNRFYEQGV